MHVKTDYQIIIIGSGFGGMSAAMLLRKNGISDFVILERSPFFGGTWCQNSYPGAAVDVQSPLYSLSTEPFDWSQLFAGQEEIKSYVDQVYNKHNLEEITRLNCEVSRLNWLSQRKCWEVVTSQGVELTAQYVISASGLLSNPQLPSISGMESFAGQSFHTSDWNHGYDYRDKRVAIIGTGSSAAQVVPAIAPQVGTLHVFQRTAHWVLPRPDYTFSGWQRYLMRYRIVQKLLRSAIYLGLETRVIGFKYSPFLLRLLGRSGAERHLNKQVSDPLLRRKLKPEYEFGCKRVVLSNAYYPACQLPNVELHDSSDAVQSINQNGIVTKTGKQIDLDLIIYATGYRATDKAIDFEITGRDGMTLQQHWNEYPRAYLGCTMPGFPNLFLMLGPNTAVGHTSAIFMIESQLKYIMKAIKAAGVSGQNSIEVKLDVETKYNENLHNSMTDTVWQNGGCNSWYFNKNGRISALYPGFTFSFHWLARRFRRSDHVLD